MDLIEDLEMIPIRVGLLVHHGYTLSWSGSIVGAGYPLTEIMRDPVILILEYSGN